ncbi:hypothetical protein [Sporichthya polymorpha]|uniref:hypothetical protein n=1 Tax=Sporichthya polymorpha TaxID=35751 RepID=UPI0003A53AC8|nr:hypothetical protein [Sporichthya polymorpha]
MRRRGRGARGATLLAVALSVTALAACGGQPEVTPAGDAGLDVPYDDSAPRATGQPRPAASVSPLPSGATPPPAIPLPGGTFQPPKPVKSGKPGGPTPTPAPGRPAPPPEGGLTLPAPGEYVYALTGTSSLGKPPSTMKATVAAAGGEDEQVWTLDARRPDGAGIIEEMTLARQSDGVYLSAYRIDASTGLAAIVLEFAPPTPVLLEPDDAKAGQTWEFDLESKDGCAAAHTAAVLVSEGKPGADGVNSVRHVRMTTTLRTIGPPTCPAINAKRVQDTYHPAGVALPARIDNNLSGSLGAVPVKSDTRATLTAPTPKSAARRPEAG